MTKAIAIFLASVIATLFLLSAPNTSFAAGDDDITYEQMEQQAKQSGSANLLAKMYGSWVLDLYGSKNGATNDIATPVTVFAALVGVAGWTLFMVLVGYVGVVGLVKTSQSGQFMGGDWNSTWVLGRILGALILSAPLGGVTAGGAQLAAGQVMVVKAALLSSSAADIVWGKALVAIGNERIKQDPSMQVQVNISPSQAKELIKKGYAHGVCFGTRVSTEVVPGEQLTQTQSEKFAKSCGMSTGTLNLYMVDSVTYGAAGLKTDSNGNVNVAPGSSDNTFRRAFMPEQQYRWNKVRQRAHEISVDYYLKALRVGQSDGQEGGDSIDKRGPFIDGLSQQYYGALSTQIEVELQAGYKNSVAQFSNDVTKNGWVSAGNYYRALAAQQVGINGALTEALSVGGAPPTPSSIPSPLAGDDFVYTNVQRAVTVADTDDSGFISSIKDKAIEAILPSAKDLVDRLGLNLLQAGDTVDPLIVASNVGHGLSAIGQFGFIPMLDILRPLFYIGVVLGDILPSLPWVFFMFGVLSWIIHVTEMFISAPLWIAAHAAPEGKEHTSSLASKGYDNMLFIMLYPLLAIGGFIAAMSVSWIGMYMLNQLIGQQFATQLGGGFGAITHLAGTLAGFAALYLGCAWLVVTMSFNLIQAFPRTILNWLSTSAPGHDAFQVGSQQIQGAAQGAYGYMAGAAVGGASIGKGIVGGSVSLTAAAGNRAMSGARAVGRGIGRGINRFRTARQPPAPSLGPPQI